jgi:hypothetical protein
MALTAGRDIAKRFAMIAAVSVSRVRECADHPKTGSAKTNKKKTRP